MLPQIIMSREALSLDQLKEKKNALLLEIKKENKKNKLNCNKDRPALYGKPRKRVTRDKLMEIFNQDKENCLAKSHEEEETFCELPEWAKEKIRSIRENMIRSVPNIDEEEFKQINQKDKLHTAIIVGTEKLLKWIKQYDALKNYEENINLLEYIKSWVGDDNVIIDEKDPKKLTITSEEKNKILELILMQSTIMAIYGNFLMSGCISVKRMEIVMKASGITRFEESVHRMLADLNFPEWAVEEYCRVIGENPQITVKTDVHSALAKVLKLPEERRKGEVLRRMEKSKGKLLCYLDLIRKIRFADVLPTEKVKIKNSTDSFKTSVFKERKRIMKNQFLSLFPDLKQYVTKDDKFVLSDIKNAEWLKAVTKSREEQVHKEKIELQRKIIMMDNKLRAYVDLMKKATEKIAWLKHDDLPKFEIPEGKTDMCPGYYSIVKGRPIDLAKFSKREYLESVRRIFLQKLTNSNREDRFAMQEERNLFHIDYLLKVLDQIDYYTEAFNLFLFENQEESMSGTKTFLDVGRMLMAKEMEIEESQQICSALKSTLYTLGGLLKYRRMCQKLLFDLAPFTWRSQYEEEKKSYQKHANKAADNVLYHLAVFKANTPVQQPSVDDIAIFLADTMRNLGPPANYFNADSQLDLSIRQLELENLSAFRHMFTISTERQEIETEKIKLTERCNKQIAEMEILVEDMSKQLQQTLKCAEHFDKTTDFIINKYYRHVITNKKHLETIIIIKEMFNEFIGGNKVETEDPVEMLDALIEDIVKTQLEVNKLPKQEAGDMQAFILDKEKYKKIREENATRMYIESDKLLNRMKRCWGPTVGNQGHPPRFRSCTITKKVHKENAVEKEKVLDDMVKLFQGTGHDDALNDTLKSIKNFDNEEDDGKDSKELTFEDPNAEISGESDEESSSMSFKSLESDFKKKWSKRLKFEKPPEVTLSDSIIPETEGTESFSTSDLAEE